MTKTRHLIKIIFIVLVTMAFTFQVNPNNTYIPKQSAVMKPKYGKTMLSQCSRNVPKGFKKFIQLDSSDIKSLEFNFKKLLQYQSGNTEPIDSTLLRNCFFQYQGIEKSNHRYIYINAISIDKHTSEKSINQMKEEPMIICDGGTYYWGALYNISSQEFEHLAFNGY